jgi:hypothetical protein
MRDSFMETVATPNNTLLAASASGNLEEIRNSLDRGAKVNTRDMRGLTPLMLATANCRLEAVKLLTMRGADLNLRNHEGNTALWIAAGLGPRGREIKAYLDEIQRVEAQHDFLRISLYTFLAAAFIVGVVLLAKKRAQIASFVSRTVLYFSPTAERSLVRYGNHIFLFLGLIVSISFAIDVYRLVAETRSAEEVLEPTVTSVDHHEKQATNQPAPYHQRIPLPILPKEARKHAPEWELGPNGPEFLFPVERRAIIPAPRSPQESERDLEGMARLTHDLIQSAEQCTPERAAAALRKGMDVNERDREGKTALSIAAEHDCIAVAKLLLDRSADVNASDSLRRTPLMWACSQGNYDMIELLLSKGADRKAKSMSGKTALSYMQEHFRMVREQRTGGTKGSQKAQR